MDFEFIEILWEKSTANGGALADCHYVAALLPNTWQNLTAIVYHVYLVNGIP